MTVIMLATATCAGAALQRLSGIGFALVAAPLLVLVLGPLDGVVVANMLNLVVNLAVLALTWRAARPKTALLLAVPALLGIPLGVFVLHRASEALLLVAIGGVLMLAVAVTSVRPPGVPRSSPVLATIAGFLSGLMNVIAGVAGPLIALYGTYSGRDSRSFAATCQILFAILSGASLLARGRLPPISPTQSALLVVGVVAGLALGQLLTSRISAERARVIVLAVAFLGSLAALVKGIALLVE